MKVYKIKLTSTGAMTQIPDSQKLFGALVYMFSEAYGSDKAAMLVKEIKEKSVHLALSSIMPFGYFPTPQDYLIDLASSGAASDVNLKQIRAEIKEKRYIPLLDLKTALKDAEHIQKISSYVKLVDLQQLRASIESLQYNIPELDAKLYSVPVAVPLEMQDKGAVISGRVTDFCFYLQAGGDSESLDKLLCRIACAVKDGNFVILGKRASQGINTFKFCGMEEIGLPKTKNNGLPKMFLNMGMLLPDCIDFSSSTLKLFTSERRPFEMAGGWEKNATEKFISFIAEGSLICAPEGAEHAGKSIESPFYKGRDIVFGNAFLYPISLPRSEGTV